MNKIVRGDYSDNTYAELGLECVDRWMHDPEWSPYFHQSGCKWKVEHVGEQMLILSIVTAYSHTCQLYSRLLWGELRGI